MKRYVLIIGVLLLGLSLRAQSVTYTCRYWFDQNEVQITTFSEGTWQTELDVGSLSDGLHTFHFQAADTSLAWCPPQSYMFLKLFSPESLLDSVDMSNLTYHCWFDQDDGHQQTGALGNGSFLFDVSDLEEGLHSVNVMLEGSALTSTQNYMFIKAAQQDPLIEPIDMSNLVYHCWFDRDYENRVIDSLSDGLILLDVEQISDGLHTVHVMLEGEALTSIQTYMFAKVSQQNSLIEPIGMTNPVYHCWFDQNYDDHAMDAVSDGVILFDVDNLTDGLHTIHILLEGEALTSTQTYMFFKKPEHQDFGITKWQYYLNGDISQLHTTEFSPLIDTLDIITLLPVEVWPVRSSCFHFHPNGDEPYLNAKNEVTFRFWTNDDRILEKSTFYVDYQVTQDIEADSLERNSTVCIAAPRDNQIQWYRLPLEFGDTVAFKTDKACTMQLFAPSGEEVYFASAGESMAFGGCHAFEDGDYYLALHDVTGSGDDICLTYVYVHKYAILAYDVHLVGNGGCSTITFQGNGFNSLLDVYLVNGQNDTIRRLDIGHENNTTSTVIFNFYEVSLGVYDAVFQFYDETIRINGALEVQEPVDIVLTSIVSYPSTFMRGTPSTYTYTITNNGNMTAYGVPIYVYIATPTEEGISHLKFEGLNLPSIADFINQDSLSVVEKEELKNWAKEQGDDHYFYETVGVDETTGDSVIIRSNFFFVNLAPFETKTLSLTITASEDLNVLLTVPDGVISPVAFLPDRGFKDRYCCVQEKISCWLDLVCNVIELAQTVTNLIPNAASFAMNIADCVCGIVSSFNTSLSMVLCEGDQPENIGAQFWNNLSTVLDMSSIAGSITNCLTNFIPGSSVGKLKNIKDLAEKAKRITDIISKNFQLAGSVNTVSNCYSAFNESKPNCPPGDPKGGKSNPVNPGDPNDIHGYLSESGSLYMRQEIQNVHYEIEFENDTTLATAAAHTIIVRDTLDASRIDLNSLAARSVTIGDKRLELNGEQTFAKTLDMRPELYVIAQINQDYDPETGIVEWTIQSLDPMTMEPTDNPYQGVLPVNYYGDGVGFIDYSVNLLQAFEDGTEISNRAGIIFDQEDVIMTPTWTNIVDAIKPTSQMVEVIPENDSLNFSFVSEDNRSGVWYHTLYHRNDSTAHEWQVKKAQVFGNSLKLPIDYLQNTEYLVKAVDSAGNVEEKEMVAEYVYYYEGPGAATQTDNLSAGWNWWSTYIEMNGTNSLDLLESGLGTNGLNIKSSNGNSVEYIPDWEMWWGDEIEVRNESMYEINVAQAGTVTVAGTQAIPGAHPITLAPGWNWIGYPVNASLPTETALASLSPTEEDVVQSRNGYSMYWPDFGFWGDVEYMTPGSGYKYMSNNAQPQTLTYPSSRGKALAYKPKTVETRPEAMQHQYLMDIVAVAELEGEELKASHYELIALSEGQPRGRASLRYCEPNGRHVAMLLVYGDASETLEFRLLDTESGKVYEGAEHMDFKAEKVVGGLRKPFTMHFGNEQEDTFALKGMFPNPAKAGETVYLNMVDTSVEEGTSGIELYNALGEHIPVTCTMGSPLSFKAPQAAGVYMVRLTSRGEVYHGTLIVTQ